MLKSYYCISSIRQLWNSVLQCNRSNKPTQSWKYYFYLWLVYYAKKPIRILRHKMVFHVVTWENDSCILPLVVSSKQNRLEGISNYRRLDYEDIISSTDDTDFIFYSIENVLKHYPGYNLYLQNVNEDSMLYSVIGKYMQQSDPCVKIALPNDYDAYWNGLSKHQRQNIRTANNKLEKDSVSCVLKVYDKRTALPRKVWNQCQHMYDVRHGFVTDPLLMWKNRHLNAYHYILRKVDDRRICVLYSGDTVIAYMAGMYSEKQKCYFVPRLCINPDYSKYSPGIVLVNETAKHLIREGCETLDLMLGDEPYKLAMGGTINFNYSLHTTTNILVENLSNSL